MCRSSCATCWLRRSQWTRLLLKAPRVEEKGSSSASHLIGYKTRPSTRILTTVRYVEHPYITLAGRRRPMPSSIHYLCNDITCPSIQSKFCGIAGCSNCLSCQHRYSARFGSLFLVIIVILPDKGRG